MMRIFFRRCIVLFFLTIALVVYGHDNPSAISAIKDVSLIIKNDGHFAWYGHFTSYVTEDWKPPFEDLQTKEILHVATNGLDIAAAADYENVYVYFKNGENRKIKFNDTRQLAIGLDTCFFLNKSGEIYILTNSDKQPRFIEELKGKKIIKIAAAACHVLAVSMDGKLYTQGNNSYNQLSFKQDYISSFTEIDLLTHVKIVQISTISQFTLAIDQYGKVYAFGRFRYMDFDKKSEGVSLLTHIKSLEHLSIVKVAAGESHLLFLDSKGNVYSCGDNRHQQLGRTGEHEKPLIIQALEHVKIVDIAAGHCHSFMVDEHGYVYVFGYYTWHEHDQRRGKEDQLYGGAIGRMEGLTARMAKRWSKEHHQYLYVNMRKRIETLLYTWYRQRTNNIGIGVLPRVILYEILTHSEI